MIPVIIGNLNRSDLTWKCIDSLHKHTQENLRIIQVDNGCEKEEQFTPYHLWYDKPLGFTRTYNEGIRFARENFSNWEHILLVNNDIEVRENWFPLLKKAIKSRPKIAMVAPLFEDPLNIESYTIPVHADIIGGHTFAIRKKTEKRQEEPQEALTLNFTCVLLNREFIDEFGLLDESMNTFCSDIDYSLRATQGGWKCLVVEKSMIWHELNQTVNELPDKAGVMKRDQITFLNKWSGLFLNKFLDKIPLDLKRKAMGRVSFLIMDEDGTIINWGTQEKMKNSDKRIVTEGVREQFEQLKRLGIEE